MQKQVSFGYTATFNKAWASNHLTDRDRADLEAAIVAYYEHRPVNGNGKKFPGEIIQGTGGAYKYRYASDNDHSGKSGGYRTIYFVVSGLTLRFIAVYPKNKQATLSDAEKAAIKKYIKTLKGATHG